MHLVLSMKLVILHSLSIISLAGVCGVFLMRVTTVQLYIIHSFHWHVQNAMIPRHSQELLPFLSVI